VPIKPEEINASKLPVAVRGYKREAVEEFLLRIAWDYRQATRSHDTWAQDEKWLKDRVAELEAELAGQEEKLATLQQTLEERFRQELRERTAGAGDELARLRTRIKEHENREEMTRTLLLSAQRSARELRESTRAECEALLKSAHRRAAEIERLRRMERDLKEQLRRTLESVLGKDEPAPQVPVEQPPAAAVD
jgi:DivIVA domain-containing protein